MLCIILVLSAGCTSLAIGDVTPTDQGMMVHVTNSGDPINAGIQVRVFRIHDLMQQELTNTGVTATLNQGENVVNVPVRVEPGTYKLYVYVTMNGERKTASIKDIVV
jgi:urease beta subunit